MRYDVIIIGGGPAGLSAGIYAARGMLSTLIIEKSANGGQAVTTDVIENYPGAPENTTGSSLSERMAAQCREFGVVFASDQCDRIEQNADGFSVICKKAVFEAKAVIIAAGAQPKMLGIPGEKEYRGMGVSYCATCDANFFRNLEVAVIGGGNTAVEEALYLTKFAKKVTIIHRRDTLRAAKILADRAEKNDKISMLWDTVAEEITAKGLVSGLKLRNLTTDEVYDYPADGVFIFVGQQPNSDAFKGLIETDDKGYILTDEQMRTTVPGIFAAGDIRKKSLRQVITAAADGAIAGAEAIRFLDNRQ